MLEYVSSEDAAVQQRLIETPAAEFRGVTPVAPGYVVAMLGGVLVVVDLKRAQERLLYEYYLLMLTNGSAVSEQLLFPERLVLSHDEYELLGQYAAEFAAVGFDIERVGDGAIDVKGTPADMPSDTIDELIYQLLQTFAHVSAADLRRQRIAAELARQRGASHGELYFAGGGRAAARTIAGGGRPLFLACGEADSGRNHARRVACETSVEYAPFAGKTLPL